MHTMVQWNGGDDMKLKMALVGIKDGRVEKMETWDDANFNIEGEGFKKRATG